MYRVCVLGAGSFGSAVARVVAHSEAVSEVRVWARRQVVVHEINNDRTNKQYVQRRNGDGEVFPSKCKAYNDAAESLHGATAIIVAVPGAYLGPVIESICAARDTLGSHPFVISLVKSLHYDQAQGAPGANSKGGIRGRLRTICQELEDGLVEHGVDIPVLALMGPNIYDEIINDNFAEATIGFSVGDGDNARKAAVRAQQVLMSGRFQASIVGDRLGVEMCGGLKNVVSLAAGFCQGLELGHNTCAAVIRAGLREMQHFVTMLPTDMFEKDHDAVQASTFYQEACGIGDLVLTCTAGRGRTLAAKFAQVFTEQGPCTDAAHSRTRWSELEDVLFQGMRLPDWHNAQAVHAVLQEMNLVDRFPLFAAVYAIGFQGQDPHSIIQAITESISMQQVDSRPPSAVSGTTTTSPNGQAIVHPRFVDLAGKRALVTGAAQGIGLATALHLQKCGASVIGLDLSDQAIRENAQVQAGQDAAASLETLKCNLLNTAEIDECIGGCILRGGPIDLLVNCAGVAKFQPFFETTADAFDLQYAVNVKALVRTTQLVAKSLVDVSRPGSIVHISSQSSTLALADHLLYSSSKAAVDHMARIQALELGHFGIRVNTIRPTVIMTELALQNWDPLALEAMKEQIPLRKLATTQHVANAVAWLLSDEAEMITGTTLPVDGGRSMGGHGL